MAVQAEKDGAARLNAVISGAQERMREAKRQAGQQAAAFETDLNSKTAAQCRALEQAAASRSGAAAAMIAAGMEMIVKSLTNYAKTLNFQK